MKIVIDHPIYQPGFEALKKIANLQIDDLGWPGIEPPARVIDPERIREADALFCAYPPVNLGEMNRLRWIQIGSTGYKQLIGLGLPERGIRASNSRGCFDTPIAEWNIAMLVMLTRDMRQMIRNQDAAVWDTHGKFQQEIRGRVVGLWGYGGIGRETARVARQLGLQVHVLTRHGVRPRRETYIVPGTGDPEGVLPHRTFIAGEEASFLAGLDYLIVAMPLTPATDGLIGERELRSLRPTAFVLNPARGPIIQERALLRALGEGWIAGAALDTHYQYPLPPEHPLWKIPNVILTPHISGSGQSTHYPERLWDLFVQNVRRFRDDKPLLNALTPDELAGK